MHEIARSLYCSRSREKGRSSINEDEKNHHLCVSTVLQNRDNNVAEAVKMLDLEAHRRFEIYWQTSAALCPANTDYKVQDVPARYVARRAEKHVRSTERRRRRIGVAAVQGEAHAQGRGGSAGCATPPGGNPRLKRASKTAGCR
eukprot:4617980-Pleurochrysis_carterae.AAC.2